MKSYAGVTDFEEWNGSHRVDVGKVEGTSRGIDSALVTYHLEEASRDLDAYLGWAAPVMRAGCALLTRSTN